MQRIFIRLLAALITFCAGVVIAAVWVGRPTPQIDPVPLLESPQPVLHSHCFPGLSEKVDLLKPSEGGYFPQAPSCQDVRLSTYPFSFYTERLKKLDEPTLLTGGHTAYRFLWLRSFHSEIAVRLSLDGEKKLLSIKELRRQNHEEGPPTLLVNETRSLTPEEWATFVRLLDESCFWAMPTSSYDTIAEDGAWWVFEGVQEDYYHVTHRQSPQSGSYRELCLYILKLSGLPLDESKGEIY